MALSTEAKIGIVAVVITIVAIWAQVATDKWREFFKLDQPKLVHPTEPRQQPEADGKAPFPEKSGPSVGPRPPPHAETLSQLQRLTAVFSKVGSRDRLRPFYAEDKPLPVAYETRVKKFENCTLVTEEYADNRVGWQRWETTTLDLRELNAGQIVAVNSEQPPYIGPSWYVRVVSRGPGITVHVREKTARVSEETRNVDDIVLFLRYEEKAKEAAGILVAMTKNCATR